MKKIALSKLNDFFAASCGVVDVPEDTLGAIVAQLAANPAKLKNAPFAVDENVLRRIANHNHH